jgi:agmatine deiminase
MEDFSMMTDAKTNFLFLADTLPKRYPSFYREFDKQLGLHNIRAGTLSGTRDIWAKDYMPVQIDISEFVQFSYDPDYLRPKKWRRLRTDPDQVCYDFSFRTQKSNLIIDGGNIIQGQDFVILTDKIFSENEHYERRTIVAKLESLFQKQVIIIPRDPLDYTGHADGMVRVHTGRCVLINEYRIKDRELATKVKSSLTGNRLDWTEIPYAPYANSCINDATGLYINYLQLNNVVFLPSFGIKHDLSALDLFKKLFPEETIIPIMSKDIAKEGGVLNCISWNIHLP